METLIALPEPRRKGDVALEATMDRRQSCREFAATALSPDVIGQLLWAAQGVNAHGRRTAPSAGARYPLETYAVTQDWVAAYRPEAHAIQPMLHRDVRRDLSQAALEQAFIAQAPLTIVLCAVYERVASRYGTDRGARYVHMEIGHAAQNVLLQAVGLGLGGVPVGAFNDGQVSRCLDLASDHAPLYLLPVGHPG
jgi:SagB-type dehydrogenase family enzyme